MKKKIENNNEFINSLDVYYVETSYHLFLFFQTIEHNNNLIIVDCHRSKQKQIVEYHSNIMKKVTKDILYIHDYPYPNTTFLSRMLYAIRTILEHKKIVKRLKNERIRSFTYFTPNLFELSISNWLSRLYNSLIRNYYEDGIGSYSNIESIIGKNDKNKLNRLLLTLFFGINLSPLKIPNLNLYYIFPTLVDKSIINSQYIYEVKSINKGTLPDNQVISNYPEFEDQDSMLVYYLSKDYSDIEEKFLQSLKIQKINFREHPSKNKYVLDYASISEYILLKQPPKYILSINSNSGLSLLGLYPEIKTIFIFLTLLYDSMGLIEGNIEKNNFLLNLQREFPNKIEIPQNLLELESLLSK
jgi:hypothetical protein